MFPVQKREDFGWVSDLRSRGQRRSVWERLLGGKEGRDDDDDDRNGPGPNAGATLWPAPPPRKTPAFA